ncbi:transcriptional repressor [Entomophthora muscae]|uniref:Transcriptional repressor n=2 Tax=Entomophthora muscae TaxID=34485 RepID=A0ACC2SK94_9FUNG|nr:transcriptional repressor [Entomophthora muscae]KAJ9062793.1 transcriptional repressor [Entomophthora muscae]
MPDKFSITNASGHKVSLLDRQPDKAEFDEEAKKKHVCSYPSCGRAFSTRGHLARHQRIHTGEKNFRCLLPQCHSRFSRKDNMMQHFRTHFVTKARPKSIRSDFFTLPPLNYVVSCYPNIKINYNL